jgi:hypothetical protein
MPQAQSPIEEFWPVLPFIGMWVSVCFIISKMGWRSFSQRYAWHTRPTGRVYTSPSSQFGSVFASYRNVVRVVFTAEGIYFMRCFCSAHFTRRSSCRGRVCVESRVRIVSFSEVFVCSFRMPLGRSTCPYPRKLKMTYLNTTRLPSKLLTKQLVSFQMALMTCRPLTARLSAWALASATSGKPI